MRQDLCTRAGRVNRSVSQRRKGGVRLCVAGQLVSQPTQNSSSVPSKRTPLKWNMIFRVPLVTCAFLSVEYSV